MTISYPVSPPSSPKPSRIDWFAGSATAVSMSPFTLQAQAVEHDGASWAVSVTYPPMDRAEAAPWMAFLASLRGRYGTFYFGDELLSESQASPGGSPLTNNPTAGSYTIPTDGWTASTNVLDKGDFISINYRLYMVTADVTSDGATAATIDVWPSARSDTFRRSIHCNKRSSWNFPNDSSRFKTGFRWG